ncbi:MAG TPA: hypothetical protein VMT55_04365, partial [Candidatus Sulfotelmatobacter sp.]|nr:hypothetical protein [Candidatus Sulfotelmatobacter sp.]
MKYNAPAAADLRTGVGKGDIAHIVNSADHVKTAAAGHCQVPANSQNVGVGITRRIDNLKGPEVRNIHIGRDGH